MEDMDLLRSRYLKKLEEYPFSSEEEARRLGMARYRVEYGTGAVALETPFSMRSVDHRDDVDVSGHVGEDDEYVCSSSSEESTEFSGFEGDLHLRLDLSIMGREIIRDSEVTIARGRKYGLVGRNGVGKTTLLNAIRKRKFGIPRGIRIHMIKQDPQIDGSVEEFVGVEAGRILNGLGFTKEMVGMRVQELSGGWRMRAQLARAISINPDLLLLDEPTNYLDIRALGWLERQVKELKTVIIVSHDRNFLDNTVEMVLHLNDLKIDVYKGNYESFERQRMERMVRGRREYENQLAVREHLQSFIDRFRYNAKRASLAQSKIKTLAKMPVLTPPKHDPAVRFAFDSTPVHGTLVDFVDVSFSYGAEDGEQGTREVFMGLKMKVESNSRIVVVGVNGQGKSTLLKLLAGRLDASGGYVLRNPGLRVGYFAQHHIDHLKINENVLDFMMKTQGQEESRRSLASFGLSVGNQRIGTLSGGQKSRLGFAAINATRPNLLVLDEPTNHLDMESIEALADALGRFEGAVVCVSHDLSFVDSVFKDIYVCGDGGVRHFRGTVHEYKRKLETWDTGATRFI